MVHSEIRKAGTFSKNTSSQKFCYSDDPLQVGLYLGPYPAVVLYDYEDARDLFNQDVVSGRNFYHPSILERPISGRPDSFVYRFRMLGNKLG